MRTLLIDDLRTMEATAIVRTYRDGILALAKMGPWDILLLDHDLGEVDPKKTGYDILNWLEENPKYLPRVDIKLVTQNPVGYQKMQPLVKRLYGRG